MTATISIETEELVTRVKENGSKTGAKKVGLYDVPARYGYRLRRPSPEKARAAAEELRDWLTQQKAMQLEAEALFLPMEAAALQNHKEASARALLATEAAIRNLTAASPAIEALDAEYPRIDLSFLSMLNWDSEREAALPLFAVFGTDSGDCKFSRHVKFNTYLREEFHYSVHQGGTNYAEAQWMDLSGLMTLSYRALLELAAQFEPTNVLFSSDGVKLEVTASIAAQFGGLIPDAVREAIRKAQNQFERLIIVAEVPRWDVQTQGHIVVPPPLPAGDPLVIGCKDSLYWLVTAFDTTPAEQFVVESFRR